MEMKLLTPTSWLPRTSLMQLTISITFGRLSDRGLPLARSRCRQWIRSFTLTSFICMPVGVYVFGKLSMSEHHFHCFRNGRDV